MKRFLFIISLFSFTFSYAHLCSQTNTTLAPTDTVPFAIDEDEMLDYNDSLLAFPSSGLYCSWDTTNIHYAKFDIATLKDSIREVALFSDGSCGYVHPFSGKITSKFGPRKKRFHYGVDIDLETGDSV